MAFNLHLHDNRPNTAGGVLCWVSNSLFAKRKTDFEIPELEALWLEIRSNNNKFNLCVIYRQPSGGVEFWDIFQESLDLVKTSPVSLVMITGDLNADPNTPHGVKLQRPLQY